MESVTSSDDRAEWNLPSFQWYDCLVVKLVAKENIESYCVPSYIMVEQCVCQWRTGSYHHATEHVPGRPPQLNRHRQSDHILRNLG